VEIMAAIKAFYLIFDFWEAQQQCQHEIKKKFQRKILSPEKKKRNESNEGKGLLGFGDCSRVTDLLVKLKVLSDFVCVGRVVITHTYKTFHSFFSMAVAITMA
jgi:hypothetical protein